MPESQPFRLAVFASGGGSNFQSILDAAGTGRLPGAVAVLVSNRPTAGALERARAAGVPTAVFDPKAFEDEAAYTEGLIETLERYGATFVALAGYLRRIPERVVDVFRHRMVNVHPALLPAFGGPGMYGRRVHEAVLAYGARWSGATVHLVDADYDTGPVVLQHPVPVHPDDTPETLAARVLDVEHRLYPAALRLFAEGRVHVSGRHVTIEGGPHGHLPTPT